MLLFRFLFLWSTNLGRQNPKLTLDRWCRSCQSTRWNALNLCWFLHWVSYSAERRLQDSVTDWMSRGVVVWPEQRIFRFVVVCLDESISSFRHKTKANSIAKQDQSVNINRKRAKMRLYCEKWERCCHMSHARHARRGVLAIMQVDESFSQECTSSQKATIG